MQRPGKLDRDGWRRVLVALLFCVLTPTTAPADGVSRLPVQMAPWWQPLVSDPLRDSHRQLPVTIESLLVRALRHSSQIRVFSDLPLIRETAIVEADAAFDWTAFMETRWDDISDPVGSVLTTGGPPRFRDENWTYAAGLRDRNTQGGRLEIAQQLGHQNSNSVFFVPKNQGTARLTIGYAQPLRRGAGQLYNTSLVVLAQIDSQIAQDEFSRQLQSHLLEVTRAYWGLYLRRGTLLQKQRLFDQAVQIRDKLDHRQELDALRSQVVRAEAAVASRKSGIVRSEMAIRNAESRIRSLINDPELGTSADTELLPESRPLREEMLVSLPDSLATAVQLRPEINQSLRQIKAAGVRLNMAGNELLPVLDAVLETYVSGLRGDSGVGQAWVDQFSVGEPSHSVGLEYESSLGNRAAGARLQRRRLEIRQLRGQFQTTVETLRLEVEVAVREVMVAYREMAAKHRAMQAQQTDVEYMTRRWRLLAGEDRGASLYLQDLLAAQDRLVSAEFDLLNASTTYNLALMNYQRAIGTLLQAEQVSMGRGSDGCLPRYLLDKPELPASAAGGSRREIYRLVPPDS